MPRPTATPPNNSVMPATTAKNAAGVRWATVAKKIVGPVKPRAAERSEQGAGTVVDE